MAKKNSPHHHKNIAALNGFISFLVLVLAFSTLLLFRNYKDNILMSGNFNSFIVFVVIGFVLLLSLLYLVNSKDKQI